VLFHSHDTNPWATLTQRDGPCGRKKSSNFSRSDGRR
jgi:hypothetical protein